MKRERVKEYSRHWKQCVQRPSGIAREFCLSVVLGVFLRGEHVIRDNTKKANQNQISKDIIDHTKEF